MAYKYSIKKSPLLKPLAEPSKNCAILYPDVMFASRAYMPNVPLHERLNPDGIIAATLLAKCGVPVIGVAFRPQGWKYAVSKDALRDAVATAEAVIVDEINRHRVEDDEVQMNHFHGFVVCEHVKEDFCACRPPSQVGLATKIEEKIGILLTRSYLIGTTPEAFVFSSLIGCAYVNCGDAPVTGEKFIAMPSMKACVVSILKKEESRLCKRQLERQIQSRWRSREAQG